MTTNRTDLADRIRVLGNYGSRVKYVNEVQGVNSRLDPIQAAVLRAKLRHLDAWTERRRIGFEWSRTVKAQSLVVVAAALMVEAAARQSEMGGALAGVVLGGMLALWALLQLGSRAGSGSRLGRIVAVGERVKVWMNRII